MQNLSRKLQVKVLHFPGQTNYPWTGGSDPILVSVMNAMETVVLVITDY